ncbi:MAG: CNNM domain-containing protein, partial [Acidobacteriota bacterium]
MGDPASLTFFFLAADAGSIPESPTFWSAATKIFLVIVLVLANGFFVAAEFAIVGVRRSRVETLAADGNKSAARLLTLLDN